MIAVAVLKINGIDTQAEARRVQKHLDTVAKRTRGRLQVKTATWKRKPTFDIAQTGPYERTISTDNEIFLFQDGGTKPHKIRAKRGRNLHFFWARRGRFVTTPEVNHPGTKAANWTKKAARQAERDFTDLMNGSA